MTTYGYIRKGYSVSEKEQLTHVFPYDCDELFIEKSSILEDEKLNELMAGMKIEDTLVVINLQIFGKNVQQLIPMFELLAKNNIRLISIDEKLDTKRQPYIFSMIHILGNVDASCRSKRVKEQMENARVIGQTWGRPTLDFQTIGKIYSLYHQEKWSMRRIANECEVSLGSVYKYTQEETYQNVKMNLERLLSD